MKKNIFIISLLSVLLISCGGGTDDGGGTDPVDPPAPQKPSKAVLSKPENNTECLEVDAVKFEWNTSNNTTSYTINVKNLTTNEITTNTSTSTSAEITLTKGYPYSWQIISTNLTSFVTESDKWKFYLSGEPLKNHAPFPAEIISPKPGSSLNTGQVQLSWSFSDIDSNDTHGFDIYIDKVDGSSILVKNWGATKRTLTLDEPGKYYWRIVTVDNHNSSSDSGVSTFTVLE
tara:strand:- start:780 stop:1472 length:693 start_codon:yes stop_codon:yes gene_type:complete